LPESWFDTISMCKADRAGDDPRMKADRQAKPGSTTASAPYWAGWALALAVDLLGTIAAFAQSPASAPVPPQPSAEVAALLEPIISRHEVPGMVAAVVDAEGDLVIGCAGVRKAGAPEKVTITDQMHIGSCTKSMTATMIATLVQDGELQWNSTIGDIFGKVEPIATMNPAWQDVTLSQLLTNRSGAPNDLNKSDLWRRLWTHQGSPTSARMLLAEGVLAREPEAKAGKKYIYSNAGFAIAGAMAEQITGESWEDLMMLRVFEPLGMSSAGFGTPGSAKSVDQPRGHRPDGTPLEPGPNADNPVAIGPAGIVHCNLIDWSKYIALHLRGSDGQATPILTPASFKALHTPAKNPEGADKSPDYAMGWGVTHRTWAAGSGGEGRVLTHNGSNTMWFAVAWLAPERGFAVLVACNKGGDRAQKACDEAAAAMIKLRGEQLAWP
jgi:CubicO group peptidase (beta-lactamase class C family)